MDEVEFDVKELFHFMNTHTDEFFIRVRFDEGGGLCGETDRCGSGEIIMMQKQKKKQGVLLVVSVQ